MSNIFPQNVPETGRSIYTPITPGPTIGTNVYGPLNPEAPATAQAITAEPEAPVPEIGQANKSGDPFNIDVPVFGQPVHTPFPTPLGVQPHFKTPTENWYQNYGS